MGMKYEWRKYIEEMRRAGYAVAVFSPEEIMRVTPGEVENWMIDCVNQCLEIREREERALREGRT